ncbi:phosphoinositide phospholipase C [Ranunculus cassubicifolius]
MASKQTYRFCFCFRRKFKLRVAKAPSDVEALFGRYSENGFMTVDQLQRFLIEAQGEDNATKEEAQAIIDSVKHLHILHRKGLNLEAFFRYLFGDLNCPLPPTHKVHQDMTAPLSEYFIYTGHNSYLTGNQLSSDCSDIPIINALQRGVRGIELDMWPNATRDDVDILHGRTLTTPVEIISCLRSIKEHAFSASPYPVIVTLEDHLTPDLQAKVAKMITHTYKDMLFYPGSECLKSFPSPDSLKRKIIISTKPPKEYKEAKFYEEKENISQKDKKSSEEESWGEEISDPKHDFGTQVKVHHYMSTEYHHDEEDQDDGGKRSQHILEPEYKHLIAIHAGKPKGGIKEALRVEPYKVKRISLSEQELEKAMINHGPDIVRFTQKNLLRIYPKGTRVDSSNYNPLIGWMHGAQMVAFNMQGHGRSLWVMHGMFRANGGCGYVKKPDFLTKVGPYNQVFDPRITLPVKKILKVRVYMGDGWFSDFGPTHFDVYSPPDFYARVGIAGVPGDSVMKRTRTIEDDWRPVWDQDFEFLLSVPELALLRIEVHEYDMSEKDDFAGQTCLPVWELRRGIRAVPLCDRKGVQYPSVKLLMRFEFV